MSKKRKHKTNTLTNTRHGEDTTSPICFVSYSMQESHVSLLIECIEIVLTPHFRIERTPSALLSGASQRDQITKLIQNCSLGVVILDGLRPNVVFEYGVMHGLGKPVIFLKEEEAQVDVRGFFGDAPSLNLARVVLDLDKHFSNAKDVHYATWNRYELKKTVHVVWDEYTKKENEIQGYIEIPEPKLCT